MTEKQAVCVVCGEDADLITMPCCGQLVCFDFCLYDEPRHCPACGDSVWYEHREDGFYVLGPRESDVRHFIAEIRKLEEEYGMEIRGCGCCQSPFIVRLSDGETVADSSGPDEKGNFWIFNQIYDDEKGGGE